MNNQEFEVMGRSGLAASDRLILLAIGKGEVRTEALTRLAGVSRPTLYRSLKRLEAIGLIQRRFGYVRMTAEVDNAA